MRSDRRRRRRRRYDDVDIIRNRKEKEAIGSKKALKLAGKM